MATFQDIKQLCRKHRIKIIQDSSPDFAEDSLAAYFDTKLLYIPDNWYDAEEDDDLFEILRYIGWIVVNEDTDYTREKACSLWAIDKADELGIKISRQQAKKVQADLDEYEDDDEYEGFEYDFSSIQNHFSYICSYCQYYKIGQLKRKRKATWLREMEEQFEYVSPYELDDAQIKAWDDCFDSLKENLKYLPSQYDDIYAVFEYVMPKHNPDSAKGQEEENGIRADCVLVSRKTTVVLEFKQRKDEFEGFIEQALKYKRRLDKFHLEAKTMKNKAILVLTRANNYFKQYGDAIVCSSDRLDEAITKSFGKRVYENQDIERWIDSFDM